MSIDPRLADRRKEVAEERARRNIGRLLRFIVGLGVLGAVVWLLLSPSFSVRDFDLTGVHSSSTREILDQAQVVMGRPLVLIRPSSVEDTLLSDPWIREADVDLDWPNRAVVSINERTPVAWVESSEGWSRRAVDGVALPGVDVPDDTMAHIMIPGIGDDEIVGSLTALGALAFVDTLPVSLSSNAVIEERSGELWAVVAGFDVRLGRSSEMEAKALSLAALLAEPLVPGSEINVIAPTNPAVTPPVEGNDGEDAGASEENQG